MRPHPSTAPGLPGPKARGQPVIVPAPPAGPAAWHPAVVFVYGFAALILAGGVLLALPFSSASGRWTPMLDALFTSTSAVCVTGLTVVDTATYWSGFGHAVILALFQVGGVGFMISATALILLGGRRATIRQRILLREALAGGELGSVVTLARNVIIFTLIAETVGAIILTMRFLGEVEPGRAFWWGVFHAISGFNNAGFDLFGKSLIDYSHDPVVLLTIGALFVTGALSYTAVADVAKQRRFAPLALDTKLVLVTSGLLAVMGTLGLLFTERSNPATLGAMDLGPRILNAFFQAVSRTAGFSSVDIGAMTEEGLFVLMGLMFVGGSAGSTAGGVKVQTFSILLFAIISAARGLDEVEAFRRRVPNAQVLRALSVALLYVALVFAMSFLLNVAERFVFDRVLFEAISALGTVGYSTGITPETGPAGRAILITSMFVGRLGPLTLVIALAARARRTTYRWTEETIKIG
jgi:trk system potassium uptake protein